MEPNQIPKIVVSITEPEKHMIWLDINDPATYKMKAFYPSKGIWDYFYSELNMQIVQNAIINSITEYNDNTVQPALNNKIDKVSGIPGTIPVFDADGNLVASVISTDINSVTTINGSVVSTGTIETTDDIYGRNITATGDINANNFTGNSSGTNTGDEVVASQAEAEVGTDNTKMMTPLRVLQNFVYSIVNKTFSGLNTTNKTIQGAINELKTTKITTVTTDANTILGNGVEQPLYVTFNMTPALLETYETTEPIVTKRLKQSMGGSDSFSIYGEGLADEGKVILETSDNDTESWNFATRTFVASPYSTHRTIYGTISKTVFSFANHVATFNNINLTGLLTVAQTVVGAINELKADVDNLIPYKCGTFAVDGDGDYTVTFTTPMADTDYAIIISQDSLQNVQSKINSKTTNGFNITVNTGFTANTSIITGMDDGGGGEYSGGDFNNDIPEITTLDYILDTASNTFISSSGNTVTALSDCEVTVSSNDEITITGMADKFTGTYNIDWSLNSLGLNINGTLISATNITYTSNTNEVGWTCTIPAFSVPVTLNTSDTFNITLELNCNKTLDLINGSGDWSINLNTADNLIITLTDYTPPQNINWIAKPYNL